MTTEQIAIVQKTWTQVEPIAETAASLFYAKLFELDPALKELFSETDMASQGEKLMKMIGIAVRGLNDLDELKPAVAKLGIRHVDYGVAPEHYDTVGSALLDTLEKGLGEAFTTEARDAWATIYTALAVIMKGAAWGEPAEAN